jgi:hypothetical protein
MPPIPHTFAAPHSAPHTRPARHNFKAMYPACGRLVNETGAGYRRFGAIWACSQQRKFRRSTRVLDANRDSRARALKCFLPDCVGTGTLRAADGRHGTMVHRPVGPDRNQICAPAGPRTDAVSYRTCVPHGAEIRKDGRTCGRLPCCSRGPDQKSALSATGIL